MDVLSCHISHKLMRLNTFSIFKVLPELLKVTHDRVIFEEYISFLVFDLFGECETVDEIIALADKLQKDIHNKKEHIFDKLIPDCLLDDLYWEPLVKNVDDKDKKKAFRKVCDQLCIQLIEYAHPYYSGVIERNSILCRVFKYSKEG